MTDGSNVGVQKLSIRTKLGYSAGALEEAMVLAAAAVTIIFYNQVMGSVIPSFDSCWKFK